MTTRARYTTTKNDLARQVADKCGISIREAQRIMDATIDCIRHSVRAGNRVELRHFGVFEQKKCNRANQTSFGVRVKESQPVRLAFRTARELRDLRGGNW